MPPAAVATHRFLLNLDDRPVALQAFDGGDIRADVVTVGAGPQKPAQKNISTLQFEPFTIDIGLSMGKPLVEWMKSTLDSSGKRKDGSIVTVDIEGKARRYRHFSDALIEEITIPAMDASSKENARFTVKFYVEHMKFSPGDLALVKPAPGGKQKKWLASNFRIRLGDLPCDRVTKIEAFTIKQRTDAPGTLEFPNLKVTFSAADMADWEKWFDDFAIQGNNGQDEELSGKIEFIDPAKNEPLGSIDLSQVGIFALHEEKQTAGRDAVARFTAELYVETMTMNLDAE